MSRKVKIIVATLKFPKVILYSRNLPWVPHETEWIINHLWTFRKVQARPLSFLQKFTIWEHFIFSCLWFSDIQYSNLILPNHLILFKLNQILRQSLFPHRKKLWQHSFIQILQLWVMFFQIFQNVFRLADRSRHIHPILICRNLPKHLQIHSNPFFHQFCPYIFRSDQNFRSCFASFFCGIIHRNYNWSCPLCISQKITMFYPNVSLQIFSILNSFLLLPL